MRLKDLDLAVGWLAKSNLDPEESRIRRIQPE